MSLFCMYALSAAITACRTVKEHIQAGCYDEAKEEWCKAEADWHMGMHIL